MDNFLWNDPDIKAPPINKYKLSTKIIGKKYDSKNSLIINMYLNLYITKYLQHTFIYYLDVKELSNIFTRCPNLLSNQHELRIEAEYLSRIVYRMSRKFRNDIGFRYTRKTLVALKKYLNTTIYSDLIEFHSCIPSQWETDGTYLPTKQMLQYALVRLQTLMKFMTRILICCENATRFYKDRISRGQSWNVSLLAFANHSKIWTICKVLLDESTSVYSSLLPYINKFQINGPEWLTQEYEFPTNLEKWLGYDLDNNIIPEYINVPSIRDEGFLDITEDDDVEFCGEYDLDLEIIGTSKKEKITNNTPDTPNTPEVKIQNSNKTNLKQSNLQSMDIGTPVCQTNITEKSSKNNTPKSTLYSSGIKEMNKKLQTNINKTISKKKKLKSLDIGEIVDRTVLKQEPGSNLKAKEIVASNFVSDESIVKNTSITVTQKHSPNISKPNKNLNKHNLNSKTINFNNINNARDLAICLKQEEEYRNSDLTKALSKNLGLMQWHAFKNKMQTYIKKLNTKGKSLDSKNSKQLLEKIRKEWRYINK